MGRLIDIRWPELNIDVVAELADEQNPDLCEEFWQNLPFKVAQAHPVVSGESIYAWTPIISEAPVAVRERIVDCPVGRLRYSQMTGNKFSIQYGRGLEPLSQPVLGMVLPKYLHLLPMVGEAVWNAVFYSKKVIFVEVRPHGSTAPHHAVSGQTDFDGVALEFYKEATRIQLAEPEELVKIRSGEICDVGSFGQYFTTWDFVNGMVRDYVMLTVYPLFRMIDRLSPEDLADVLDELDHGYTEFLGYCGLTTLFEFSKKLRFAVRHAKNKDETRKVMKAFLFIYGNRLAAWFYQMFPWHIGIFHGRKIDGQAFPGTMDCAGGIVAGSWFAVIFA